MTETIGYSRTTDARLPWGGATPDIVVHSGFGRMRGAKGTREFEVYSAAKYNFDMVAAEKVLRRCITRVAVDRIIALTVALGLDARIVIPHLPFAENDAPDTIDLTAPPRNALPFVYAGFLKMELGCPIDEEIVQIAHIGRTKLSRWARLLHLPSYIGAVRPGRTYIIADDVVTTGGTFAALRSYIARSGGSVVFATALANGTGKNQPFAGTAESINHLRVKFGPELDEFWMTTFGHGIDCLTEVEAQDLGKWTDEQQGQGSQLGVELLQRLRDRIDKAAVTGR